ncbi:MAG: GFA family protein [Psychromonas sp.]|nr:GFA family protein [Alteromonadales bacterium]MCP5078800.1 GFA family protein [Psychromonas sp.]
MKISGNCLCGKVSFECDNRFDEFHLCHCTQCQKATGSAHASNLFTNIENIYWLSGLQLVKRFDVDGRTISKAFCMECGSGVPYISATGKALVVPAGCLNGKPEIDAQDHIFCSEKAQWYDKAVCAKQFETFSE